MSTNKSYKNIIYNIYIYKMGDDPFKLDFTKIHILEDLKSSGLKHIFIHLCTAIGAWGGYPDPPAWWADLVNSHELVKWFLLVVLIFQGGDKQELQMALEFTVLFYLVYHFTNHFYKTYAIKANLGKLKKK